MYQRLQNYLFIYHILCWLQEALKKTIPTGNKVIHLPNVGPAVTSHAMYYSG